MVYIEGKHSTCHTSWTDDGSIREFLSLAEAQHITGISRSNICEVCRGIRNHAGGST